MKRRAGGLLVLAAAAGTIWAAAPATGPATQARRGPGVAAGVEPRVHDPVMIKEGDWYYVYYTGGLINGWRTRDLFHWERLPQALGKLPGWIGTEVPNARGLWAPDISYFGGKYHLYYAASTFGSNRSCIGMATNKTLDPGSPDYKWEDHGKVVESQRSDRYNAIDPNVVLDEKGTPWLSFGSFWSGIKLRKLGADGMADPADTRMYDLAAREGDRSIEAPFIVREGRYFYLFVSFDRCCQGVRSTYRLMVGRSEAVTGPYVDRENKPMLQGGGTQLLAAGGVEGENAARIVGPGHCGLLKDGGRWLLVHHYYDATDRGVSKLQVRPVSWDDAGWPVLGKPVNAEK